MIWDMHGQFTRCLASWTQTRFSARHGTAAGQEFARGGSSARSQGRSPSRPARIGTLPDALKNSRMKGLDEITLAGDRIECRDDGAATISAAGKERLHTTDEGRS